MKILVEKYDMRKIDVSARMGLTPAAITQYMKGERGAAFVDKITKSERTMEILSELAEALARDSLSVEVMTDKLCKACLTIRSERICELHQRTRP